MRNTVAYAWLAASAALASGAGCKRDVMPAETLDARPLVRTGRLVQGFELTDGAQVQGAVRAKFSAAVASRVGGTLDAVMADEGEAVKAGQPLFQVDKVNLDNRVRLSRDDWAVARALLKEAEAALLEAQAGYDKAALDAGRMRKLYEEAGAVTRDAWEKAELQHKLASATRERARAAAESARVRIAQAETALSVAEKNLSDSLGTAPFDGVITRKLLDRGDFAAVGNPVFEMDDPRVYEVCFSMSASDYARVVPGETRVRFADGQEAAVTYKAPSVHPVTRTFEIRVTVDRSPDLAPGMLRDAWVVFRTVPACVLPAQAVGLRGGQTVAFVVKEGRVLSVPVETGLAWQGRVEIRNPEALQDADVVTEGMLLLNVGDAVRVAGETGEAGSAAEKTPNP